MERCEMTMAIPSAAETRCRRAALAHCNDCRIALCNAHIHECEICELYVCRECLAQHRRKHRFKEDELQARRKP